MDNRQPTRGENRVPSDSPRRWIFACAGLLIFHFSQCGGAQDGLWLPSVGIGLALVAWIGWRIVPAMAADLLLVQVFLRASTDRAVLHELIESLLLTGEIALSWWLYSCIAKGARRLDDPRSATLFLILVPGLLAALFAGVHAGLRLSWDEGHASARVLAGTFWISRALGILVIVPALLVVVTPFLVRWRLTATEKKHLLPGGCGPENWTLGEIVETGGLSLGTVILSLVLVSLHLQKEVPGISLWGFSLLLVVWASLRQGLRGGALAALAGSFPVLLAAYLFGVTPGDFSPLQGNILAQCSTALLVGASAGWIRASEARYRQVVGHIPLVLYSARLPREFSIAPKPAAGVANPKREVPPGPIVSAQAEITLVSSACRQAFGCEPDAMLGPFQAWLDRIVPEDREVLLAALNQMCLRCEPIACEYRIHGGGERTGIRWLRDTMVAFEMSPGNLAGWEGVVEDITEQRALSNNLRRTSTMLQALVANLPTGVFFVQGHMGQPILVNQRARQLLGQREDLAAGIDRLAQVYHLHKPDGSEYPVEELPVTRALREGLTCMANDIVVHRPDGRRIPLVVWAAPIDLAGAGKFDSAVWVFEQLAKCRPSEAEAVLTLNGQ